MIGNTKYFCVLKTGKKFNVFQEKRYFWALVMSVLLSQSCSWAQYPPKMSTTGPEAAESRVAGNVKLRQGRSGGGAPVLPPTPLFSDAR